MLIACLIRRNTSAKVYQIRTRMHQSYSMLKQKGVAKPNV